MKENKYDDDIFFEKYSQMPRSKEGLAGAGEWHALKNLLPDLTGKRVLDLGCGYGWHCRYAVDQGARYALGVDLSGKMLEKAARLTVSPHIEYRQAAIEDIDFEMDSFDMVISSLALHYVPSFEGVCRKVSRCLVSGGFFVFSVEHPIFTAYGMQDWYYDEKGSRLHWPVDTYFSEGSRRAVFLGEEVVKYHKTLTTYINGLIQEGFEIMDLVEPKPEQKLLEKAIELEDELRRPMMLLISASKK